MKSRVLVVLVLFVFKLGFQKLFRTADTKHPNRSKSNDNRNKMSWQAYVDDHLMCEIEGNHLSAAAIISHDGSIWAQSPTFPVKPEEITAIMKDFDEPGSLAPTGLYVSGTKYMVIQGEVGVVIRGKKVTDPDKNMGSPMASESFKKVHCAYEVLSDSLKKRDYHEQLRKKESKTLSHKSPGKWRLLVYRINAYTMHKMWAFTYMDICLSFVHYAIFSSRESI